MGRRRNATAGDEPRGGAAQGSPEFTKSGAPGVVSTRAWVGCVQRITRDAPGPKTRYGGALLAGHGCRGGSARRSSPARCVRAVPVLGCGAKGSGRLYEANARQRGFRGVVWCCGGVAMAERRRGITGGSAPPTEWPTAQISWRKRRHGAPGCSPRGCGGRICGAG